MPSPVLADILMSWQLGIALTQVGLKGIEVKVEVRQHVNLVEKSQRQPSRT
jgi:regulator of protease activity HflC (stomatin/prohibitin superfamily)